MVTDAQGRATVPANPGDVVRAVASVPGPAVVHLGEPLRPHPYGGQLLLTAGPPVELLGSVTVGRAPADHGPSAADHGGSTAAATTDDGTDHDRPAAGDDRRATDEHDRSDDQRPLDHGSADDCGRDHDRGEPTTAPTSLTQVVDAVDDHTGAESTTTSSPGTVPTVPPASPPPPPTLPATGGRTGDIAAAGAVVLGAGIGALVGLRRRPPDLTLADDGL